MDSVFILTKLGIFFYKIYIPIYFWPSDRDPTANIFGADVAHLPGRERDQGSVLKDPTHNNETGRFLSKEK